MLLARGADADGRALVVVGLSAENVRRLRANEPIDADLGRIGIDARLLVFGGRGDEDDLRAVLAEHVDLPDQP